MTRNKSLHEKSIRSRAYSVGLPRTITNEFVADFLKCLQNNGPEWTVSRFKEIKAAIVYYYANGSLPETKIWIKKVGSDRFADVYGWLQVHMHVSRNSRKRVLRLLNIYTSLVSDKETETQRRKFFESVRIEPTLVPPKYHQMIRRGSRDFRGNITQKPRDFLTSNRRRPGHEARMLSEFYQMFGTEAGRKLVIQHHDVLFDVLGPLLGTQRTKDSTETSQVVGNIHVSQEPGFKARYFASPHLWLQQALDPLKKGLKGLLQLLPWDGTHNQQVADRHIIQRLSNGELVHCFDLSDATNVFPLELQITLLRSSFSKNSAEKYIRLFETISSMAWNFEGTTVVWTRGQALGLGPSFAMFAATHGMLIYALNGYKHDDKFFVIGDDVVILDNQLADKYQAALGELALPYSPTKTLRSNKIAEFAGYVFQPEGKFQTPKWKNPNKKNLLDMVRVNGPGFIQTLKPDVREFVTWFVSLPEPLGLGWNPTATPLDKRISGLEDILEKMLFDPKEPQGAYDYRPRLRLEARLQTLDSRLQGRLISLFYRSPHGKAYLSRLETEAYKEAASHLPEPLTALLRDKNHADIGKVLMAVASYRDVQVHLPQQQPKRFVWKKDENLLPKFNQVRNALLPIFELQKKEEGTITLEQMTEPTLVPTASNETLTKTV